MDRETKPKGTFDGTANHYTIRYCKAQTICTKTQMIEKSNNSSLYKRLKIDVHDV